MGSNGEEWVMPLVRTKFFKPCNDHKTLIWSGTFLFCMDCSNSLCWHCLISSSHGNCAHNRLLTITTHNDQPVVELPHMQEHFDCSDIQVFRMDGKELILLNPANAIDTQNSSGMGDPCEACGRLARFCSIACKVSVQNKIKMANMVRALLQSEFFTSCHHKALKMQFCMVCSKSLCLHCVNSRNPGDCAHNRLLQIARLNCNPVVALPHIQDHFDCSHIQVFTCNGNDFVQLNSPILSQNSSDPCEVCAIFKTQVTRFCSIACKVSAQNEIEVNQVPVNMSISNSEVAEEKSSGNAADGSSQSGNQDLNLPDLNQPILNQPDLDQPE